MTNPLRSHLMQRSGENSRASISKLPALQGFLPRDLFVRTLYVERKRSERSGRGFVLMLLESAKLLKASLDRQTIEKVLLALSGSTRDTDIKGWYREDTIIGVIFTELGDEVDGRTVANALLGKVTGSLAACLTLDQINEIRISFHVYPEDWEKAGQGDEPDSGFYDDLLHEREPQRVPRAIKRSMDIAGSLLALIVGAPLFAVIAIAIKLTSQGPVFFRQKRLGQYGRTFGFLKFRSMKVNNDPTIHREYVKRFIANGDGCSQSADGKHPVYKLAHDPRVTSIGSFLRRTSLDELPQFINVLKGEMSLVGPRPPVPYEVEAYRLWHRTRLLAAKPGITGLWQVSGRSRVKFDDMVRMDLRYASSWSLWLDLKILIQTPQAVLSGNGAH